MERDREANVATANEKERYPSDVQATTGKVVVKQRIIRKQ